MINLPRIFDRRHPRLAGLVSRILFAWLASSLIGGAFGFSQTTGFNPNVGGQLADPARNLDPLAQIQTQAPVPFPIEELPVPNLAPETPLANPRPALLPGPWPVPPPSASTVRIKDITTVDGHRSNRIDGMGLVTGLKGTGGKQPITAQFAKTMLQNYNILANQVSTKSLSVVTVSAEIPPFLRPGEKFTATVAVFDEAQSLYGGQLQRTELKAIDGKVYALAAGALQIGGFSASGDAGAVRKNHDTVGKVQGTLEVEFCDGLPFNNSHIRLLLRNKDYTTAYRIETEINRYFPHAARAGDAGAIDVVVPRSFAQSPMEFLDMIHILRVEPDIPARVVINEKTGTIVVGKNVKLSSIVFAKDNLIIATSETPVAAQPAPFSQGETVVLPRTQIQAIQQGGRYNTLPANATVGDLANVLNLLGVAPQDLISVFVSLKAEGSLQAELVFE